MEKEILRKAFEAGRTYQIGEYSEYHGAHEHNHPDFETWFKSQSLSSVEGISDEEIKEKREVVRSAIQSQLNVADDVGRMSNYNIAQMILVELEMYHNGESMYLRDKLQVSDAVEFLKFVWLNKYTDNNDAEELYIIYKKGKNGQN